ncbi:MazG-like family protein [Haemophilus parainfluenzae]|uniref:Pyrophosphatase n=1 Tax=Haemophilus parainfluenzae TaxID=729 RepID=A0AAQ0H192_HAEPA|nr:MazG-like family protein [Haemophilus parainfluenzae]RDE85457.1 pyrophosphatase [Haemophilus parainfluenzae]
MTDLTQLIKNIENWAEARNLIEGSTPKKQFIKLMEEFGELCAGIARNDKEKIKDSIGDCSVVVIILTEQLKANNLGFITAYKATDFPTENNEIICLRASGVLGNASNLLMYMTSSESKYRLAETLFRFIYYISKIALNFELNFESCLISAYNEIKDRKGRMINGVFVKEGDL